MSATPVLFLTVIICTSYASDLEQKGSQQAVILEVHTKSIAEFVAIKRNFSKVILDEVFKVCQENINKCKPVESTTRSEYTLTIVLGYPKSMTGITNRIIVAFYVHTTKALLLPRSTLFDAVKDSRSIISQAIGYQVGSIGRLQLPTNTAPPTGPSSHDRTLLIFLGVFVGVMVLTILIILIVCLLGQKANKEPELKEFTNSVINEDQPPTTHHDAWSNPSSKHV